eukprot:scaffold47581_cov66-Phaeocystis_antarctica.AAC.2
MVHKYGAGPQCDPATRVLFGQATDPRQAVLSAKGNRSHGALSLCATHALLYVAAALPLWGATPAAPRAAPIRRATLATRNQPAGSVPIEQLNKLL